MKKFDLLFQAPHLREKIQRKMEKDKITTKQLCDEASELGVKGLNPSSMSRFFSDDKGKREGAITQGVLVYVMMRLGLTIDIYIRDSHDPMIEEKAKIFAKTYIL
jgi:hypothetical protein